MKYYKLISDPERVWDSFKIGKIYPDDFIARGKTLKYWLKDNSAGHLMVEVTEEEYNLQEGKIKEFVLPEKWCVRLSRKEVSDYCNKIGKYPPYPIDNKHIAHFPAIANNCTTSDYIHTGYTEITYEQFIKYVLKQDKDVMKNQAETFKITGSKPLLKAMWEELMGIGYKDNTSNLSFTKLSSIRNSYFKHYSSASFTIDIKLTV
jgi:hypothetical protein